MDIKKNRRDAAQMGKVWDKDLPMIEGMYPGDNGNSNRKGQGSAGSDANIGWDVRAQSWQRGADSDFESIRAEAAENNKRFGTPDEDNFPAPSDPKGPKNCGARYQTASYDANDTLPSPHNFSNNPGFMGTSTGDMARGAGVSTIATNGAPSSIGRSLPGGTGVRPTAGGGTGRAGSIGGGVIGRSSTVGRGNISLPAPGDTDPGSEGSPQIVTSGYSG